MQLIELAGKINVSLEQFDFESFAGSKKPKLLSYLTAISSSPQSLNQLSARGVSISIPSLLFFILDALFRLFPPTIID